MSGENTPIWIFTLILKLTATLDKWLHGVEFRLFSIIDVSSSSSIPPICGCMRTFRLWDCREGFSHLTGQLKRCQQGASLTEIKRKLFIKVACDLSSPLNEITLYRLWCVVCLGRPFRAYSISFWHKPSCIKSIKKLNLIISICDLMSLV